MKIDFKKGADIKDIFLALLVGFFIFTSFVVFAYDSANQAGVSISQDYNSTYKNLTVQFGKLNDTTTELRNSAESISELSEGEVKTGLLGFLTGGLAIIKAPFNLISIGIASFGYVSGITTGYFPPVLITMGITALTIIILFPILRLIFGRSRDL